MIPFFIVMLVALVLIIGLWNGASSFGEAYWQALLFLEVMNIYDGVVIYKLWVGHSQFWVLPGLEDAPFVQTAYVVTSPYKLSQNILINKHILTQFAWL